MKNRVFKNVVNGSKSMYDITDLMVKQDGEIVYWGSIEGFYNNDLMKDNRTSIEKQEVKYSCIFNFSKLYIEL